MADRAQDRRAEPPAPLCPSAQPDMEGAAIFGVVGGTSTDPRVGYLSGTLPVTDEIVRMAAPVKPAEVFRMAAPCALAKCRHYDGARCSLAQRTVDLLDPVVNRLPACLIRPRCRWWQEQGPAACFRCPQVVTENWSPSTSVVQAAGAGRPE